MDSESVTVNLSRDSDCLIVSELVETPSSQSRRKKRRQKKNKNENVVLKKMKATERQYTSASKKPLSERNLDEFLMSWDSDNDGEEEKNEVIKDSVEQRPKSSTADKVLNMMIRDQSVTKAAPTDQELAMVAEYLEKVNTEYAAEFREEFKIAQTDGQLEISLENLVKRFPQISKPNVPVVQIDSDSNSECGTETDSDCQIVSHDTDSSGTSKRSEGNSEPEKPKLGEYFEEVNNRKVLKNEKILKDEKVMAALVAEHMTKVAPELAVEFKKEFPSVKIQLTLSDVVNHFHQTSKSSEKANKVLKKDLSRKTAKKKKVKTKIEVVNNKKVHIKKRFTAEEDKLLMDNYKILSTNCFAKVAEELGRTKSTVKRRYERISSCSNKKTKQSFTLEEDLKIIDNFFEILPWNSSLVKLKLDFDCIKKLSEELSRDQPTVRNRAEFYLKPWLLQHYAGTLDLDKRCLLANFLVKKYENMESIDWKEVVAEEQFQGNDVKSMKVVFKNLKNCTAKHLNVLIIKLSLQDIVDNTNRVFGVNSKGNYKVVSNKTLVRQGKVIDYFDEYIKKNHLLKYISEKE